MNTNTKNKLTSLLATLKTFFEQNGYLACAFVIPVVIHFMVYIAIEVWPFGDNSVLVLDLNGQYVYFFEALRNAVMNGESLVYSWSRALGGEFTGIYAYYIASPLSYIVCLFPKGYITEALLTIILLKCGISGATMAYYLRKTRPNFNEISVIVFSVLYALSSYAIVYAHNTMWIDALMLFPLVMYGEEMLIKEHKFKLFIITLSLTVLSNFYIGYMVCIFVAIYYFYYTFISFGNDGYNKYGEKAHLAKSFIRIVGTSVIAIAISAIIILPTYYSLKFGKTEFTDPSWTAKSQFDLLDFIIKMYPGAYDTVRPEGLPWMYCGMLSVMLVPLYFVCKKVSVREKIAAAVLIVIMVLSMNINVIDMVWHGFQRPNWLNYRYSFMVIFMMVVFAARVFEEIRSFKFSHIAISGTAFATIILVAQKLDYTFLDSLTCIWFSVIVIFALLIAIYSVMGDHLKGFSITLLAVVVSVEMFVAGLVNVMALDSDVVYSGRSTYTDYMDRLTPTIEHVKEKDPGFYRMEKFIYSLYQADGHNHINVQRKVCDNMALDIYGISNSTSTLNASIIEYLNLMGYASHSHWSSYIGGNPVSDALLGIKYVAYSADDQYVSPILNEFHTDEKNNISAYVNPYALSVAYAVNSQFTDEFDINDYYSPFDMMNAMITAMLGEDETVEVFKAYTITREVSGAKVTYDGPVYETVIDENGNETQIEIPYVFYAPEVKGNPAQLKFKFTVPEDVEIGGSYMFLSSNYPRSVNWYLLGNPDLYGSFFENESDCIQFFGNLTPGKTYTALLTLMAEDQMLYLVSGVDMFYYIDMNVYKDVFQRLSSGNFIIDEDYEQDHIKGTINVSKDQSCVYTSIPYDEGWKVYIDGKETEIYKTCDSLIGFDIEPGSHKLELKYSSDWYNAGAVISICGVVAFVAVAVVDHLVFKPKRQKMLEELITVSDTDINEEDICKNSTTSDNNTEVVNSDEKV